MLNRLLKLILFMVLLPSAFCFARDSKTTLIKFRIHRGAGTEAGLNAPDKKIIFFAFPDKKSFESDEGIEIEAKPLPDDPDTYVTTDLKPGTYTFSAYEDTNKNGQHDKNFAGMPKEPFAISKITKRLWSHPAWEETQCQIEEGKTIDLEMLFKFQ